MSTTEWPDVPRGFVEVDYPSGRRWVDRRIGITLTCTGPLWFVEATRDGETRFVLVDTRPDKAWRRAQLHLRWGRRKRKKAVKQ